MFTMVSPQMCSDHGHDAGNLCDCDIFWGGSTCSTPFTSTIPAVQWGIAVYASIAAHAIVAVFAFLCLAHKWRACASCRGTNARDVVMGATCVASALRVAFLVDPGGMRGIYSPAVSSVLSRVPQVWHTHTHTHTRAADKRARMSGCVTPHRTCSVHVLWLVVYGTTRLCGWRALWL